MSSKFINAKKLIYAFINSLENVYKTLEKEKTPETEVAYRRVITTCKGRPGLPPYQIIIEVCMEPAHFIGAEEIEIISERYIHDEPQIKLSEIMNGYLQPSG